MICLADSTADYLAEEEEVEVRACVCLSAFAKLCGIFLFAFVSSLCTTLCAYLDKDLPSFHTLFILDEGFLCMWGGIEFFSL